MGLTNYKRRFSTATIAGIILVLMVAVVGLPTATVQAPEPNMWRIEVTLLCTSASPAVVKAGPFQVLVSHDNIFVGASGSMVCSAYCVINCPATTEVTSVTLTPFSDGRPNKFKAGVRIYAVGIQIRVCTFSGPVPSSKNSCGTYSNLVILNPEPVYVPLG